jgi:hypothetical protein
MDKKKLFALIRLHFSNGLLQISDFNFLYVLNVLLHADLSHLETECFVQNGIRPGVTKAESVNLIKKSLA